MPALIRYAEADVPTEYGVVRTVVYRMGDSDATPRQGPGQHQRDGGTGTGVRAGGGPAEEHVALVVGDVRAAGAGSVLVRVHSECWTGEVMHSLKCDCRDQLDRAMRAIVVAGRGVVVYLRQEGRGIGLGNKVRAYALQQNGVDTVEANRILGFADDARQYDVAAAILRDIGALRVRLMTNNPNKVDGLAAGGIEVSERVALWAEPNEHNAEYLAVKARKMGHVL